MVFLLKTRKALSRHILNVVVSNENPWTIEPWHIRAAFRRSGFCVPESAIELHRPEMPISGPNKDLEGKQFLVSVKVTLYFHIIKGEAEHGVDKLLSDKQHRTDLRQMSNPTLGCTT